MHYSGTRIFRKSIIMSLKSINPYTNEVIEEFEEMTDEELEKTLVTRSFLS